MNLNSRSAGLRSLLTKLLLVLPFAGCSEAPAPLQSLDDVEIVKPGQATEKQSVSAGNPSEP